MTDPRQGTLSTLAALLRQVWPGHPAGALDPATAFTDAGLSSGHLVVFLSRIEDEFSVDWEDLAPAPGALASLGGIADVLSAQPIRA